MTTAALDTPKTTAKDMLDMLRRHYIRDETRPGGIFAPEITAPQSARRADLIWQGVTAGTGYELVGHEIKVSRTDLIAELDDPTKCDPWMRYCDRWYLVLPSMGLADGLDLPATWGVLTPPSGRRTRSMTVSVEAPKLNPAEQSPALRTLAAWQHWRLVQAQQQATTAREDFERERAKRYELENLAEATNTAARTREQEVVEDIIQKLGGVNIAGDIGGWAQRVQIDDVVDALRDLSTIRSKTEKATHVLASTRANLRRVVTSASRVLQEIPPSSV